MFQRIRTEKARVRKLLNAQKLKLEKKNSPGHDKHIAISTGHDCSSRMSFSEHVQHFFFTRSFTHAADQESSYYDNKRGFERDRRRSVLSLIKSLVAMLSQVFQVNQATGSDSPAPSLFHILNAHIVDDTSTKMRGPCSSTDRTSVVTIMNAVQSLHVRRSMDCNPDGDDGSTAVQKCGSCLSMKIPTPLIILENADTQTIHDSFTSCAMVTSAGIGAMFAQFGLQKEALPLTSWRTFAFVGDALKANDSAYRRECEEMAKRKRSDSKHLAIRVKCGIHQLCLIRKPVVLMVDRLWSTVVRLSHLFESMTFRKNFARTMASLVSASFVFVPATELPSNSHTDHARQVLKDSFRCQSIMRRNTFEEILEYLNGNLELDTVVHHCVSTPDCICCENAEQSLAKCLQLLIPFCSRGYQVPLLYRFKHYDEAICYITFLTSAHNLLSRTLSNMEIAKCTSPSQQAVIDKLLGDCDLASEGPGTDAAVFGENIDMESFQSHNAKRKQLVLQEVTSAQFRQKALMVDFMIKPMDHQMNRFFARTKQLARLTLLEEHDTEWQQNAEKCRALFLSVVSGEFGQDIITKYCSMLTTQIDTLVRVGFEASSSNMQTLLTMGIVIISDTWRRFVHEHATYPWKMFSLLNTTLERFVQEWDCMKHASLSCRNCFDMELSLRLLDAFPELHGQPHHVQQSVSAQVKLLLRDLAVHVPLTSDPVEIKNGQVQVSTSRRTSGATKAPAAARETSFLQTFIRDHELVRHWVEEQTLPAKATVSGILKRVGLGGKNQHSKDRQSVPINVTWAELGMNFLDV